MSIPHTPTSVSTFLQKMLPATNRKAITYASDTSVSTSSTKSSSITSGCMSVRSLADSISSRGIHRGSYERVSSPSLLDRPQVRFGKIEIREYSTVLSDNPSVSSGPAIGIGWDYDKSSEISLNVDEYEKFRGPRRNKSNLQMPPSVRTDRLKEFGFSRREIDSSAAELQREKRKSKVRTGYMKDDPIVVVAIESAQRKLKRLILRKKKDDFLYEEWKREKKRADAAILEECLASQRIASDDNLCDNYSKDLSHLEVQGSTIELRSRRKQGLPPIVVAESSSITKKSFVPPKA